MQDYTNIRIGFSRTKGCFPIISWGIRLIEGTPYSHVYVGWSAEKFDTDIVYQASGSAVNFVNKSIFIEKNKITHSFDFVISKKKKMELVGWALRNVGTNYGVMQVVGILYVKFMYMFGKKVRNPFSRGRTSQICSELVGIVLKEYLGQDIQADLDVVGPRGIFNFIKKIKTF